uniref:Uncharacterized protein n=1 Tax=Arundo donax TaxID=35708 RepID=A0A0A9G1W1_ARUDO
MNPGKGAGGEDEDGRWQVGRNPSYFLSLSWMDWILPFGFAFSNSPGFSSCQVL